MPAVAKVMPTPGRSIMLTPTESAATHSRCWSARSAAWFAASAAEHAVSYDTHGPCIPSTNEMRPEATEWLLPVAAYTLRASDGVVRTTSAKSFAATPRKTPATRSIREVLWNDAPCSASNERSRSSRCWGSIAPASDGDTLKNALSKSSASLRKPPYRARWPITPSGKPGPPTRQRSSGTSEIRSLPHDAICASPLTRPTRPGIMALSPHTRTTSDVLELPALNGVAAARAVAADVAAPAASSLPPADLEELSKYAASCRAVG
mmetsp:Transcript_4931/g.15867  ORF Transcript_4931/g.15867 Transcript_4931/m.15867 type:complete len:264 (-) Transcript_4931:1-792(-)